MQVKLRTVAAFVLLLSVLVVGAAQEPPTAQQVMERFTEALSAGELFPVVGLLAGNATWSEHDLYWRTVTGTDLQRRASELIRGGVRLESDVVAVMGDGQVVIAHERMWGDFVPEGLAPLRSTTVYVVESGWLVSITRLLSSEQRDALVREAFADSTWSDGFGDVYYRYDADGTYHSYPNLASVGSANHIFSGTCHVERGVGTYTAAADSRQCNPGERLVMRFRMIDQDTVYAEPLADEITCGYFRETFTGGYTTFRLADE
jgi:hypothetical protein